MRLPERMARRFLWGSPVCTQRKSCLRSHTFILGAFLPAGMCGSGDMGKKNKPQFTALFENELGRYRSKVHGKIVEIVPWCQTFLFKDNKSGLWSVSEVTTLLVSLDWRH